MKDLPIWRVYWITSKEAALLLNLPHAAEVFAMVAAGGIPRGAVSRIAGRIFLHLPTLRNVAAALEAIT